MDAYMTRVASFVLLLVTCPVYNTSSKVFYITTSVSDPCPSEPCLTLSQFAANTSIYLDANTTLNFQPGNHSLDSELLIADICDLFIISNLTIVTDTKVMIEQSARFHFMNISNVHIEEVEFRVFGGNKVELVSQLTIENSTFTGRKGQSNRTALELVQTTATIVKCVFTENMNGSYQKIPYFPYVWVGGAVIANKSILLITGCEFKENRAEAGGAVFGDWCSNITIVNSTFIGNNATCFRKYDCIGKYRYGGALFMIGGTPHCHRTELNITGSNFTNNQAMPASTGGAITAMYFITMNINGSHFINNTAYNGGAIHGFQVNNMTVVGSLFSKNSVDHVNGINGGAILADSSTVIVHETIFTNNKCMGAGCALYVNGGQHLNISSSNFSSNTQPGGGGTAVWAQNVQSVIITGTHFFSNVIDREVNCSLLQNYALGFLTLLECNAVFKDTSALHNKGSLSVIFSNITFKGFTKFLNNCYSVCSEGGAITSYRSNIVIEGVCTIKNNHANSGGAMHVTESKVYVYGRAILANNAASYIGGGIYLYRSELNCKVGSVLQLKGNSASWKGGGIHAISSTISLSRFKGPGSTVTFADNNATMGGGLCFEMDSKLYMLDRGRTKSTIIQCTLTFLQNKAEYGGAVYVADFGMCSEMSVSKECFFQVVATYYQASFIRKIVLNFTENYAQKSGSTLYGGLLDRCIATPPTNTYTRIDGVNYMKNISNIKSLDSISSEAVALCLCTGHHKNCGFQQLTVRTMKGRNFTISLVAVNQVSHPIKAFVRAYLFTEIGGLGENQLNQSIGNTCNNLSYSVYSPNAYEQLILYADGPCKDTSKSKKTIHVEFIPCHCPIGFQPKHVENYTTCGCECDSRLYPYITDCDYQSETLKREGNFWISYINNMAHNFSSGFLIYPNCPLDYCKPSTPAISLQIQTQSDSDAQCADNRSGLLCGTCLPEFSLSLGSSRCIQCSSNWPRILASILIAAILAGIALVILLLMLNMTVAVGTLNGIIFYANIVGARSSTFFPYSTQNFLTVFIAWLNLDIGFDTCFFKGMDAYWKTLLQLAFPTYVIFLVVGVILISECSTRFAQLIGRKNPVATLATLILLSYTKLLHVVIASLSYAVLDYPDGTHRVVWLSDATVDYLKGKHIVLFIVAILILVAGVLFTLILFTWQWLLHYQNKAIFWWVRYLKLHHFVEPYHAPYNFKHRYWTGLLLLVRSVLYFIISVLNVSNDPSVNFLAIAMSMLFLLLMLLRAYRGVTGQLYRKMAIDLIELVCYMNIIMFTTIKLYALSSKSKKQQTTVAYISGSITFAVFIVVLVYHIFTELITKTNLWKKIGNQSMRSHKDETVLAKSKVHGKSCDQNTSEPTFSDVYRPSDEERLDSATAQIKSGINGESTRDSSQRLKKRQLKDMTHDSTSDESLIDSTVPLLDDDELLFQTMDTKR